MFGEGLLSPAATNTSPLEVRRDTEAGLPGLSHVLRKAIHDGPLLVTDRVAAQINVEQLSARRLDGRAGAGEILRAVICDEAQLGSGVEAAPRPVIVPVNGP